MRTMLIAACAMLMTGCPPPGPKPIPGATCEQAEARLEELQCEQDGVQLWEGFAEMCRANARDGVDDHSACVAGVASCSQVEAAWEDGCR